MLLYSEQLAVLIVYIILNLTQSIVVWLLLYVESNCEVANKIDSYLYLILQSLGAPEWKGPPSSMLIFYDTELRLVGTRHSHGTDVSPSCLGLRRGTRAEHWVKQLICQNNLKKN